MNKNVIVSSVITGLVGLASFLGYESFHHTDSKPKEEAKPVATQPALQNGVVSQLPSPLPVQYAAPAPAQVVQAPTPAVLGAISPEQALSLADGTQCTVSFRSAGGITLTSGRVLINSRPYKKGAADPLQFTVTIANGSPVNGRQTTGKHVTATGVIGTYNGSKQLQCEASGVIVQ